MQTFRRIVAQTEVRVRTFGVILDGAIVDAETSALSHLWRFGAVRREWTARLLASCIGILLSVVMVEAFLRQPWVPLPSELGTRLHGCYDAADVDHAIYYFVPRLKVDVQKPYFETRCVFGRVSWHHHGDRWGFRNPENWDHVDVVLLGDSMTYGHGSEESATIAHFLRQKLGVRVGNLGITGGSPVEYLAYFRNFGLRLSPRVIILMGFVNDLEDIEAKRTREEMRAFVENGMAPELSILGPEDLVTAMPRGRTSLQRLARSVLTYQTWLYYRPKLTSALQDPALWWNDGASAPPPDPRRDATSSTPGGSPLAAAYARRAFKMMKEWADEAGVVLILVSVPGLNYEEPLYDDVMQSFFRETARATRIPFLDLRPALSGPYGHAFRGDRIRGDGHFTAQGARRASDAIARYLKEQGLFSGS